MCTVTFFPLSSTEFVLTSSRDESPNRATLPPKIYSHGQLELLYPKDAVAGGTWVGASSQKRALTLMNGGFVAHKRKDMYRLSRGVVVLELLETDSVIDFVEKFDFQGIEPFTVVLLDWAEKPKLLQLVWDERELHLESLPLEPHIWSSSPLYTSEMHAKRKEWFEIFKTKNKLPRASELWKFHHEAGKGDKEIGLQIDRGVVRTKSITQLVLAPQVVESIYHDLESGETQANILMV
ncbi:MAG TPA: NRDE family protein [Flavobacteriaceae bacterium]|nr:NRDE family protein [Flavobacteriaceae bacterium]